MAQATECKPLGYLDPPIGVHATVSQNIMFNDSYINYNDKLSSEKSLYLGRELASCVKHGTHTSSIILMGINSANICTSFDISKPNINISLKDRIDVYTEEQTTQNLLEASGNIVLASNSLLQNSKPLDGKPLDILNKTYKRLFKQTPTRL